MAEARKRAASRKRGPSPEPPADEAAELGFEAALERLEGIVGRLEQGDLELEEALRTFEEGVTLTRQCAERLDRTERRIEVLVQQGEELLTRAFEPEAEES